LNFEASKSEKMPHTGISYHKNSVQNLPKLTPTVTPNKNKLGGEFINNSKYTEIQPSRMFSPQPPFENGDK
jgi:hypothetical protein